MQNKRKTIIATTILIVTIVVTLILLIVFVTKGKDKGQKKKKKSITDHYVDEVEYKSQSWSDLIFAGEPDVYFSAILSFLSADVDNELFESWKNLASGNNVFNKIRDKTLNEVLDTKNWDKDEEIRDFLDPIIPDLNKRNVYVYFWTLLEFYEKEWKPYT